MPWWVDLGYPAFEEGKGGFPRTGQVIKHYRRQRRDEKGKMWTQSDLAHVLNIQKQAVIKMENHDTEIDTERRKFLCGVLGIPPLLLSVVTLEEALRKAAGKGKVPELVEFGSGNSGAIDVEEHQRYLTTAKTTYQHASATGILENVNLRMGVLYQELEHANSQKQKEVKLILFEYHLLAAGILGQRSQQTFRAAIRHVDRGERYASSPQLKTICFLQKGDIFREMGYFEEALEAFKIAQTHSKHIPDYLNGIRLLYSAPTLAKITQDESEKRTARSLVEQAGNMLRASSPLFIHGFDYSEQKYHLRKAETLINVGHNRDALRELALVQCQPMGWWQIQQNLLEAQAFINLGDYEVVVPYTEAALSTIKAFDSDFAFRAQAIYNQLCSSPYKNSPDVARLGYLLKS